MGFSGQKNPGGQSLQSDDEDDPSYKLYFPAAHAVFPTVIKPPEQ